MASRGVRYTRGDYRDKWRLERQAAAVRGRLGLSQLDVLDPWRLADLIPAHVFYTEDVVGPDLAALAGRVAWDGFAYQYPDESMLIIVLNSARPSTRQQATLMEELCHGLLRHPPTRLAEDPLTGLLRREYHQDLEHEAYDLGATILLPKEKVQLEVSQGTPAEDLAQVHGCSVQLVHYRIRRCRLWNRYQQVQGRR